MEKLGPFLLLIIDEGRSVRQSLLNLTVDQFLNSSLIRAGGREAH